MDMLIISLIVFLPTLGALILAFFPSRTDEDGVNEKENKDLLLFATLAISLITFALTVGAFLLSGEGRFHSTIAEMQYTFSVAWIPAFNIHYAMGLDGISFPLIPMLLNPGKGLLHREYIKGFAKMFEK